MAPPGKRKHPTTQTITFDKASRLDYLTGFHKRKVQRTKRAQEEAAKRVREERIQERKELRESRKKELQEHVEAVKATLKPVSNSECEDDESDTSIHPKDCGKSRLYNFHQQDEFVDEEKLTTVTVEAINFDESSGDEDGHHQELEHTEDHEKPKKPAHPKKEKKKRFTYLTKAEMTQMRQKIKATKARRNAEGKDARKSKRASGSKMKSRRN